LQQRSGQSKHCGGQRQIPGPQQVDQHPTDDFWIRIRKTLRQLDRVLGLGVVGGIAFVIKLIAEFITFGGRQ
jgi:hypothetical protein